MTETEFLKRYNQTLRDIEETVEAAINERDLPIDYEPGDDTLTLSFSDGSVAIISRQSAVNQLWLAARSGGFHYDYDADRQDWVCTIDGRTLREMLSEICRDQGGVEIEFG